MTHTAANHEGAIEMLSLHLRELSCCPTYNILSMGIICFVNLIVNFKLIVIN